MPDAMKEQMAKAMQVWTISHPAAQAGQFHLAQLKVDN
jgi:hypothetical protein